MDNSGSFAFEDYELFDEPTDILTFPKVVQAIEQVHVSSGRPDFVPITLDEVRNALGEKNVFSISVNALKNLVGRGSHETIKKHLEILKSIRSAEISAEHVMRQERLQWAQKFEALVMAALATRGVDFAQAGLVRKSRESEFAALNEAASLTEQLRDARDCIYGLEKSLAGTLERECALRLRIATYEFDLGAQKNKELDQFIQKLMMETVPVEPLEPAGFQNGAPDNASLTFLTEDHSRGITIYKGADPVENIELPSVNRPPPRSGSIIKRFLILIGIRQP